MTSDFVEKTSILKNAIRELEDSVSGNSNAPSTSSTGPPTSSNAYQSYRTSTVSTSEFGQRASENFRYHNTVCIFN